MKSQYEMNEDKHGTIDFFPVGFDRSNLINISSISSRFSKYINEVTGRVIDCENFYKNSIQEVDVDTRGGWNDRRK